jgi:hypothetical protein
MKKIKNGSILNVQFLVFSNIRGSESFFFFIGRYVSFIYLKKVENINVPELPDVGAKGIVYLSEGMKKIFRGENFVLLGLVFSFGFIMKCIR